MSVYQSNVSKNKVDLKQAQYKDIDKRYYDQLIQLKVEPCSYCFIIQVVKTFHCMINSKDLLQQTTEMANKDLDRYYNALDK